jgi:Carboxypeptidase regulatory-like domain
MRTKKSCLAVVIALALSPLLAAAQTTVEQTIQIMPGGGGGGSIQLPGMASMMGGPRTFKTGTGRLRGRVLASDGTGPIRRAQVRISGSDVAPKAALTDAEGRFEFRELPAGRFTLQASKSGFVSVQYGQTRPFESGKPIELADKQSLDNADISMPRGSVIAGRIVDEFGDAIPDVSVTAMRQTWQNGRRRLVPSPGRVAQTNDLGHFRIYGLPPGDYYVSATLRTGGLEMVEVELMAGTAAWNSAGPTASAPKSGYSSTYYPGTPNIAEAQRITLAAGQESPSADFALVAVRLAKVSGIVIGSDGKPLEGAAVSTVPANREFGGLMMQNSARTAKDGSFTLPSVPPGDYTLQVRSVQVITSTQGDNMMVFRAASMGGGDSESGSTPLAVAGEDVAGILLTTSKGGTATGQLAFDGPRPTSLGSIRITSVLADSDGPTIGGLGAASAKDDGSFELKGLTGLRLIRLGNAPPGWTLKSVKLNGTDITDTGAEFKPGETTSGLEVELTNRSASVNGSVTASDGSLLKDYTVVIFSETPEQWRFPMTRWVTGTRPDQDGRFKVESLPAGNYLAVAVDYVPQGEWGDPELLDRLKSNAKRFALGDGATQTLDLKLTGEY